MHEHSGNIMPPVAKLAEV